MNRLATLISLVVVASFVSIGTASNSTSLLVGVTVLFAVAALVHHFAVHDAAEVVGGSRVSSLREFLACLAANTFRFGVAAVSIAWVVIAVRSFAAA